jgi:hypothetical protein
MGLADEQALATAPGISACSLASKNATAHLLKSIIITLSVVKATFDHISRQPTEDY